MHTPGPAAAKHLTFTLEHDTYGVDILCVREIRRWSRLTRLPQAPDYLPGILSLRGAPVPVMDLRRRFGLPVGEYDDQTVLVILDLDGQPLGLIVDAVTGVEEIVAGQVHPVPEDGAVVDREYLTGLADGHGQMIMLLAPERLLHAKACPADSDTADDGTCNPHREATDVELTF